VDSAIIGGGINQRMASAPWTPAQEGVHQICYLLAEYQKIGTNQGQVYNAPRFSLRIDQANTRMFEVVVSGETLSFPSFRGDPESESGRIHWLVLLLFHSLSSVHYVMRLMPRVCTLLRG
jgi:hypothetical protein